MNGYSNSKKTNKLPNQAYNIGDPWESDGSSVIMINDTIIQAEYLQKRV